LRQVCGALLKLLCQLFSKLVLAIIRKPFLRVAKKRSGLTTLLGCHRLQLGPTPLDSAQHVIGHEYRT
jgi:hypothetical protein